MLKLERITFELNYDQDDDKDYQQVEFVVIVNGY